MLFLDGKWSGTFNSTQPQHVVGYTPLIWGSLIIQGSEVSVLYTGRYRFGQSVKFQIQDFDDSSFRVVSNEGQNIVYHMSFSTNVIAGTYTSENPSDRGVFTLRQENP